MHKNCDYCGKRFSTTRSRKLCCSSDCSYFRALKLTSQRYYKKHIIVTKPKNCKICNKAFLAAGIKQGALVCSAECQNQNTLQNNQASRERRLAAMTKEQLVAFRKKAAENSRKQRQKRKAASYADL
jgi:hypothetical protein